MRQEDSNSSSTTTTTTTTSIPETPPIALTPTDLATLATPDAAFVPHSWTNLQDLIASNSLHKLTRSPSQLRAYLAWTACTRARHGSITAFLLSQKLHWAPAPPTDPEAAPTFACADPTPFADGRDFAVLVNDWPYAFAEGIAHVVVWLKTPLPTTPDDGDLTSAGRGMVERFVRRWFRERVGEEQEGGKVLWFKNWTKLQSVRGIDHVHVLLRDVEEEVLRSLVTTPQGG